MGVSLLKTATDHSFVKKSTVENYLQMLMAGRVAEELLLKDYSVIGIEVRNKATELAMSAARELTGLISYDHPHIVRIDSEIQEVAHNHLGRISLNLFKSLGAFKSVIKEVSDTLLKQGEISWEEVQKAVTAKQAPENTQAQ